MIQWWDVTSKRVLFERIALAYGTSFFITESRFEDFVALQLAVFSKLQMRTVSVPGTYAYIHTKPVHGKRVRYESVCLV